MDIATFLNVDQTGIAFIVIPLGLAAFFAPILLTSKSRLTSKDYQSNLLQWQGEQDKYEKEMSEWNKENALLNGEKMNRPPPARPDWDYI